MEKNLKERFYRFSSKKVIKRYSHYTTKGAVIAEIFNRTIRNLLKEPVFKNGNANWVDELYN